jgi:hypothetical protein
MTVAEDATTTDAIRVDLAGAQRIRRRPKIIGGVSGGPQLRHGWFLAQEPKGSVLAAEARPEVRRHPDVKAFHPTTHQDAQKVLMLREKDAQEKLGIS